MTKVALEHINMTVSDPDQTAAHLQEMYGWHVRWSGPSKNDGYTVHVGSEDQYIALYRPPHPVEDANQSSYAIPNGLNHLGLVVEGLDAMEQKILSAGFETYSHGNYEPGRRFYYRDHDGVEFEVISYTELSS